jgi:hypothetical protein
MNESPRLIDRFREELAQRGVEAPGEVRECGMFLDIYWPPCGDAEYLMSRVKVDPSFTIKGYTRYVAIARVLDEIRFFAARIDVGEVAGADRERVSAVERETDEHEMAIFETISDAVTFTLSYLGGASLRDVPVRRIRPTPERYR